MIGGVGAVERFLLDVGESLNVPHLEQYWRDEDYRKQADREIEEQRAICHAHFDDIRDRALRRLGYLED